MNHWKITINHVLLWSDNCSSHSVGNLTDSIFWKTNVDSGEVILQEVIYLLVSKVVPWYRTSKFPHRKPSLAFIPCRRKRKVLLESKVLLNVWCCWQKIGQRWKFDQFRVNKNIKPTREKTIWMVNLRQTIKKIKQLSDYNILPIWISNYQVV